LFRIILIFFTLFSLQAEAGLLARIVQCANWFNDIAIVSEIDNQRYVLPAGPLELKPVASAAKYASINTDLFSVTRVVRGVHGGERVILKRNIAWHDGRRNVDGDMASITQDLRLPSALLGLFEARYFGFQQINSKEMIVPTVEELNKAIEDFNRDLSPNDPRLIKVRFYESQSPVETAEDYVRRFARPTEIPESVKKLAHDPVEIPVSLRGRSFTHDISAHVLEGVFGSNEYFEILQGRARLWLDFVDYAKTHSADSSDFAKWSQRIFDSLAYQIDQLGMSSGNFVDPDSKLQIKRVGHDLTHESQAYKNHDPITEDPGIDSKAFLIAGMDNEKVPALSHSAWDFFISDSLTKDIPSSYISMFKTFIATQTPLFPERFKTLSFNLPEQAAKLNGILDAGKDKKKREAAMANLPISAPYIGRLNRIRDLISATSEPP